MIAKIFILALYAPLSIVAYMPLTNVKTSRKIPVFMKLDRAQEMDDMRMPIASRRKFFSEVVGFTGVASALITSPKPSFGISPFLPDNEVVTSQLPRGDKIDVNGSFVDEYKKLRGMFPHAAGKIASNGPYTKVSDIYKIEGLTDNDIKMFKKYEKELIALPPGRTFNERVNSRVST